MVVPFFTSQSNQIYSKLDSAEVVFLLMYMQINSRVYWLIFMFTLNINVTGNRYNGILRTINLLWQRPDIMNNSRIKIIKSLNTN